MKNYKNNIRPLFSTVYFVLIVCLAKNFFISYQIISHFSSKSSLIVSMIENCVAFEIHMIYFETCEVTF